METETVELAGLPLARLEMSEVVERVFSELTAGRGGWLVTANLDFAQRAAENAAALRLYSRADLVVADGTPLIWAARLKGRPLPERVAGSDLVWVLAERAAREGRSLYLLGGEGDAAEAAAHRLRERHPELVLAGASSPEVSVPPEAAQLDAIRSELERSKPDLVYVALGSPKQELVIDALRGDLPASWMMGCGISLSFIAGSISRAPGWMQRSGLEWVHRMLQEPARLGPRYFRNVPFALRLLWASWRSRSRGIH